MAMDAPAAQAFQVSRAPGGTRWAVASLIAATVGALTTLLLPSVVQRSEGAAGRSTLLGQEPITAVVAAAVPVVAALPALLRGRLGPRLETFLAATVLALWVLLASASVGLFHAPACVLMVIAAVRRCSTVRSQSESTSHFPE